MIFMKCKTALNRSRLYGLDYTINPYYGCSHACIYCYVPSLLGISYENFKKARAKENIVDVLKKKIRKKRRGIVGISTATDAYQPLEKKYLLTRKILKILNMYKFPVDIQTKSSLVLRDINLIKEFEKATVGITITTMNEEIVKKWEINSPSPYERIDTARKLVSGGIYTYIFFGPVFPLMKTDEIQYAMEEFINYGIKEIIVDKLHIKKGMMERIKKFFPHEYKDIARNKNFFTILKEMMKFEEKIKIRMAWK